MNVLFIHTLVLALASHRIAAHEQSDSDFSTASYQGGCIYRASAGPHANVEESRALQAEGTQSLVL
jgi:hypothetical protein